MSKYPPRQVNSKTRRRPIANVIVAALILISGVFNGFSSDALGQETTKKTNKKKSTSKAAQFVSSNWGVKCQPQADGKKLACVLSQTIVVAKTGKVFANVSIRKTSANSPTMPYMAVVRLPHGLALASGFQYQIDDQKPGQLMLYTTSEQGVFARLGLTPKRVSSLQKGNQLKIAFSARNGRKITFSMSLIGFTAGFDKLK